MIALRSSSERLDCIASFFAVGDFIIGLRQTAKLVNIIPDRVNQTSKARLGMREAREHGYWCFGTAFIAQRKPTSFGSSMPIQNSPAGTRTIPGGGGSYSCVESAARCSFVHDSTPSHASNNRAATPRNRK